MRLTQQLLAVTEELGGAAEQGRHVVHELRHQARVGIISLAVVIRHHLQRRGEREFNYHGGREREFNYHGGREREFNYHGGRARECVNKSQCVCVCVVCVGLRGFQ